MLLDVVELIGDFGPNVHSLLEAEDALVNMEEVFAYAAVDSSGNANIKRSSALPADIHGFIDAVAEP